MEYKRCQKCNIGICFARNDHKVLLCTPVYLLWASNEIREWLTIKSDSLSLKFRTQINYTERGRKY